MNPTILKTLGTVLQIQKERFNDLQDSNGKGKKMQVDSKEEDRLITLAFRNTELEEFVDYWRTQCYQLRQELAGATAALESYAESVTELKDANRILALSSLRKTNSSK